jgi:opacity protein-like surface antigen
MMKILKTITCAVALSAAVGVMAEDVEKEAWHFSPYFWLPSMDVDSTVNGLTVPIDMSFGDIMDNFDVFAISARGEYWWGEWGVVADGLWMNMETDDLGPAAGNADAQLSDGIVDVLAAYRMNLKEGGPNVPSMRILAGGRYHYFKQELTNVPGVGSVGGSEDWFELVLGAQFLVPMGEKWLATARGDVGGFGIGEASDLTASVMAGVGYEFARNWLVKLGYRYYTIDYSTGSGTSAFGIDGNMHGPWLGVSYGL